MTDKDKEMVEDLFRLVNSQKKLIDTLYKALKDKPKQEVIYKDNSGLRLKYEALKKEHLELEEAYNIMTFSRDDYREQLANVEIELMNMRFKVQNHYEKQGRV
jgi:ribosomal protein L29